MPEPGVLDRTALTVNHLFWQAVDLVYPPVCISCGRSGERWCQDCQAMVERVGNRICQKCGKRLFHGQVCGECRDRTPHYAALRSYGLYRDPLRLAILRIKYHRDLGLGELLAGCLKQLLEEQPWQPDLLIPVPLSPAKLHERGYNQVDLFARPLAWSLGLPYHEGILLRLHEETSQVKLTAQARRRNVRSSFGINNGSALKSRQVLLVDDVATTGSTADTCARILMENGVNRVTVVTLARSLLRKTNQEVT